MSDAAGVIPIHQVPLDLLPSAGNRLTGKIAAANAASDTNKKSELKKVAQEFEAVFISQMLKVMRETIEESGLTEGGFGKSIYTEMFDQEVSLNMARHGTLGVADILYRSLVDIAGADESQATLDLGQGLKTTIAAPAQDSSGNLEMEEPSQNDISDLQLPVQAPISSPFGLRRDPFTGQAQFHKGIDLAAPEGMTVVSALPGKVISAGYERGYGNAVLVEHDGGIRTRYGHLASINVKAGDAITSDIALGTVGSTGRSTGPHLHFEVMRNGKQLDPMQSYHASASGSRMEVSKTSSQWRNIVD